MGYNRGEPAAIDILLLDKTKEKGIDGASPAVVVSQDGGEFRHVSPNQISQGHRGAGWYTVNLTPEETDASRLVIQAILPEQDNATTWRDVQYANQVHVIGLGKDVAEQIVASITDDIDRLNQENSELGDNLMGQIQKTINDAVIDSLGKTIADIFTLVNAPSNQRTAAIRPAPDPGEFPE